MTVEDKRSPGTQPAVGHPHASYRDSGVEWLGPVPAHWHVKRLKFAARLESGHTPSRQRPEYWENCTIPWFSLSDVWQLRDGKRVFVEETNEKVSELGLANSAARLLPAGTVVLSRTASVGFSGIMAVPMATTQDFANWVCGPLLRPKYLLYVFRSMKPEFDRLTMGSTHQTIYMPDIAKFVVPLPSLTEQDAIVAFVEQQVPRIDAMIAKKERLIALLEEKRAALISHAVTKGLNPEAPMKDSGIDWLGPIPSHWKVKRLKFAARLESGHTPSRQHPEYWVDCTIPWLSLSDVWQLRDGRRIFVGDTNERVSEIGLANSAARLLPAGTVVLSRTASVGFSGIMSVPMATTQDFANWVCGPLVRPEYLLYVFRSMKSEFERLTMGSTHQTIYMPDIAKFVIPLPPRSEQDEIVEHIHREVPKLDTIVEKNREVIAKLQEHRVALISAAVTGKIDVREPVNAEATSRPVPAPPCPVCVSPSATLPLGVRDFVSQAKALHRFQDDIAHGIRAMSAFSVPNYHDRLTKVFCSPTLNLRRSMMESPAFRLMDSVGQATEALRKQMEERARWIDKSTRIHESWFREHRVMDSVSQATEAFQKQMEERTRWIDKAPTIPESWFREYRSPLDDLQSAFSSRVSDLLAATAFTPSLFTKIDLDNIGRTFEVAASFQSRLHSSMIESLSSYDRLVQSLQRPAAILLLPDFAIPGANYEITATAYALKALDLTEEEEEPFEAVLEVEAARIEEARCEELLARVDSRLITPYRGARDALASASIDRARHVLSSLRELWNHVLWTLAPDASLAAWSSDPRHYHDGKPTRKARIQFICRAIALDEFAAFVDSDTKGLVELLGFLNRVHDIEPRLGLPQLKALVLKTESWLLYLLQIHEENQTG